MLRTFAELEAAARVHPAVRLVVVAAHDPDALEAVARAEATGLARGIYVGEPRSIRQVADRLGVGVGDEAIVAEPDARSAARTAIAMIAAGDGDLLMKGRIATADLVRAILDRESGLRTGRALSQVIAFTVPALGRIMLLTDAAINIAPDLARKADICRNAIEVAHVLGSPNPNVALVCALEFVNPEMPATVDAAALTTMNRRGQIAGAHLEGPIALDAVLSRFAAERKGIASPVVEDSDIIIAPDIEAANILYRAICYLSGGESGGVVVGASIPVVLLSRAESPETKLRSIAIAKLLFEAARGGAGGESN